MFLTKSNSSSSVCIISMIRVYTLIAFNDPVDPTWDMAPVAIWSNWEINGGTICATLPALRAFVLRLLHNHRTRSGSKSNGRNGQPGPKGSPGRSQNSDLTAYTAATSSSGYSKLSIQSFQPLLVAVQDKFLRLTTIFRTKLSRPVSSTGSLRSEQKDVSHVRFDSRGSILSKCSRDRSKSDLEQGIISAFPAVPAKGIHSEHYLYSVKENTRAAVANMASKIDVNRTWSVRFACSELYTQFYHFQYD